MRAKGFLEFGKRRGRVKNLEATGREQGSLLQG
jgi:hypothetical protein